MIETLSNYIASEILKQPGAAVDPKEPLISGGLVDSFHLVDLALFIEDTYGVRLDDTELTADSFDTVEELAALIRQRQG